MPDFGSSPAPLVLDIETVPALEALAAPYPEGDRLPPANYKSDEAIAKWREADRAAWASARAKECSINPRLGRVVSIAFSQGGRVDSILAPAPTDERLLLQDFWARVEAARGRVVTWNGSWDLRFLLIRSIVHGVRPTVQPSIVSSWFKRFTTFPHLDCKAVLTNWDAPRAGEGLTEWATLLGIDGKTTGTTGADVWPMVQAGRWDELREYNEQDVIATAAVYETIAPYFA